MSIRFIENVGGAAGDAATELGHASRTYAAGNVIPVISTPSMGGLKYYDRVNSRVRQIVATGHAPDELHGVDADRDRGASRGPHDAAEPRGGYRGHAAGGDRARVIPISWS
jgi:hypothetical protein